MSSEIKSSIQEEAEGSSFEIRADFTSPWGKLINEALEKSGRPERFFTVSIEDGIVAEGIWTQEDALDVTQGIILDTDGQSGGQFFRAREEDYEEIGELEDKWETSKVDPEVLKALIESGVFKLKQGINQDKYVLNYPRGTNDLGILVEMTHSPSRFISGKESISLHFMI